MASFLTPSLPDDVYIRRRASVPRVPCMMYIFVLYTLVDTNIGTAGSAIDAGILAPQDISLVVGYFFGLLLCASLQCYIETGQCVT